MINKSKIAGYLEDAGDDPASACQTLKSLGINHAVLKHVWAGNIINASDSACQKLKDILNTHSIIPAAMVSDLGHVQPQQLSRIADAVIHRAFNITSYFKVPQLRIGIGTAGTIADAPLIQNWADRITSICLQYNIQPLLEITNDSYYNQPTNVAQFLSKNKRWKLLYDPVQVILRANVNPFTRYWTLLKQYAVAIDVRDYKIGVGYKPLGFGDCHLKNTLDDIIASKFNSWFYFEPSLGQRCGDVSGKSAVFKMTFDLFESMIESV